MTERSYRVSARGREPLVRFMVQALEGAGCSIIRCSPPDQAPFRISFRTPDGGRSGIVAYAFLANNRLTRNRPADEHRFQVKYGPDDGRLHELWQDPFGLYTTLFVGINPEDGFFVGADPVHNSPTRFFISKEFKQHQVDMIQRQGWHAWERDQRSARGAEPVEVLVGGTAEQFLRYVRFEQEALGEDQGHRQLLAERMAPGGDGPARHRDGPLPGLLLPPVAVADLHALEREFDLNRQEILDLIGKAPRLKMAVRGWVAEHHLVEVLGNVPEVVECSRMTGEGQPDVEVILKGGRRLEIECKNVLRQRDAAGHARVDFMRTRAAQGNPCSRYYSAKDFPILAACLHAVSERWEYRFRRTADMTAHPKCPGKLGNRVVVDEQWSTDPREILLAFT